jgi:hypothetical protein
VSDELLTTDVPLTDEVRTFLTEVARLYAAGADDEALEKWFVEDFVYADHRPLGGATLTGREDFRHYFRTTRQLLPDFRISVHVLALAGSTYLARDTYTGSSSWLGGGETLLQWWVVDVLRDGRLAREDIFETEEQARAAFAGAVSG